MPELFDLAIAAIFAREILEAAVIITQYRTLVRTSKLDSAERKRANGYITSSAVIAASLAIGVIVVIGIILHQLGNELNEKDAEIIEGVSKIVASFCIAHLSLKIPKWLGLFGEIHADADLVDTRKLRFNIGWNIFREIGEIGVFLIPFFLAGNSLEAIGLSALSGIAIAVVLGIILELLEKVMSKLALAIFSATLTGWLAVGLFAGGCHEIEEVAGELPVAFRIEGKFMDQKRFPMSLLRPFGYSDHPTELQVAAWWAFAGFLVLLHIGQYLRYKSNSGYESNVRSGEAEATAYGKV